MKVASIKQIKDELAHLSNQDLQVLCLQLAKYKKENKELMAFLLFSANDIDEYISAAKNDIDELFTIVSTTQAYFAKKTLRKILRVTNKYIKYTSNKIVEVELYIHFYTNLKDQLKHFKKVAALDNMQASSLKKLETAIASLHEDLQYDYLQKI